MWVFISTGSSDLSRISHVLNVKVKSIQVLVSLGQRDQSVTFGVNGGKVENFPFFHCQQDCP